MFVITGGIFVIRYIVVFNMSPLCRKLRGKYEAESGTFKWLTTTLNLDLMSFLF